MSAVKVYSLFDRKARQYGPPLVAANDATMVRELQRNIVPESLVGKYCEDFDLVHLAYMDDENGKVTVAESQELIANLAEVLNGTGSGS